METVGEKKMESGASDTSRSEKEKMRLVALECEICDRRVWRIMDHAGVTICAECHRDIVSPHIHD
ncbi:MAG: hypothetical protein D084_Lepto4C00334G0002 [Leptospirillum sp. Group IV 'UBA BS']|jgi:hypothetical protein|nr:MAG: hypothetical protein D084_Lepto4C00334G0002 [Leptospirillum sp. Group IV 'UBA BS']